MTDFVARARSFVEEHFPEADAAFLGGSAASGKVTETSDLDILVVLPETGDELSYVETTRYQGQLVEAFVYGRAALREWLEKGRAERRPVLYRLIGEGRGLTDNAVTRVLQETARKVLAEGPAPLSRDELRLRTYSLSSVLDDLTDVTEPGEQFILSATAWRDSAELALLLDRRWIGNGKWLLRELRVQPDAFGLVAWVTSSKHDTSELTTVCRSVLEAAGGYLQEGFVRGNRPTDK